MPTEPRQDRFQQVDQNTFLIMARDFGAIGSRTISSVHLHHTFMPDHALFDRLKVDMGSSEAAGAECVRRMWRFHTQDNGWRDIAQHLSIDPDGGLWPGRNWNVAPASARGHNGTSIQGPFMIEMIGNFDVGADTWQDAQKDAAEFVIAALHSTFGLSGPDALRFHREMSQKTCPGSSLDKNSILSAVAQRIPQIHAATRSEESGGSNFEGPLPRGQQLASVVLGDTLARPQPVDSGARSTFEWGEELSECGHHDFGSRQAVNPNERGGGSDDEFVLTPELQRTLKAHVVNLTQGAFSTEGVFTTSKSDADRLIKKHLKNWMKAKIAVGVRPRVVLYAHGGVTSEEKGLALAARDYDWWLDNDVYPIFFVWETGILESLIQILELKMGGARGVFDDVASDARDYAVERIANVSIKHAWDSMKLSALRASEKTDAKDRGGYYLARALRKLVEAFDRATIESLIDPDIDSDARTLKPEIHAIGHSAGGIFMGYLMEAMNKQNQTVESLHLMAPACTVDLYREMIEPHLPTSTNRESLIRRLRIFNLDRSSELTDGVRGIYGKSILYLVRNALEKGRAPILGLEESFLDDEGLARSFRENAGRSVLLCPTPETEPPALRSCSSTHSFDKDGYSLTAALCNILGVTEVPQPKEHPLGCRKGARGVFDDSLFSAMNTRMRGWFDEASLNEGGSPRPPQQSLSVFGSQSGSTASAPIVSGRAIALCMGIDTYASIPLSGCVNDMHKWAATFRDDLGFDEVITRMNEQLGRAELERELRSVIGRISAGDILAIQYSGHGSRHVDLDDDEADGRDEALVPHDFDLNGVLFDDVMREIYQAIPSGAHVFVFMDCCHSSTNHRALFTSDLAVRDESDLTPRFMPPHIALRASSPPHQQSTRSTVAMRHTQFSACLDPEFAYESNGGGHFTEAATMLLRSKPQNLDNTEFLRLLTTEFERNNFHQPSAGRTQTPSLKAASQNGPFLTTLLAQIGKI